VLQAGTKISREFEEVVPQEDGLHTYISIKSPLLNSDGVPCAISGVSTDITERKRLMDALERAQRHKDLVIATIAHELRQPLGAIQAALALMAARVSREKGERGRTIVERQVAEIARLVDDLLDASRIAQGKIVLRRTRITINEVIHDSLELVQPSIRERDQELRLEMPDDPIWIEADVERLQQVFSNLLTNAIKFTERGGCVFVLVEAHARDVTVRVRDTGKGIAREVLPHVFDLFAQASPDGGGLGIGLAVVRGLVHAHGGTVEARSDGLGEGSEFVVSLPVVGRNPSDSNQFAEPAVDCYPTRHRPGT
jgi:signal transduction histidine kinase